MSATPVPYTTPVTVAQQPAAPAPSAAAAALDPFRLLRVYWVWLAAACITGAVVGIGAHILAGMFFPKFRANVTFQAFPVFSSDQLTQAIGGSASGEEGEVFINTQVQIIESDPILRVVLDDPTVRNTTWARKYIGQDGMDVVAALQNLRDVVNARMIPNSTLFQAGVGVANPSDAATIANAVGRVYLDDHARTSNREVRRLITNVNRQITELRNDINARAQRREQIMGDANMTSIDERETAEFEVIRNLQPQLVLLRQERELSQSRLNEYESLLRQDGPPVYPDLIRESSTQSAIPQRLQSEIRVQKARIGALRRELGPAHPEVTLAEATRDAYEQEYAAAVEDAMASQFAAAIESLRSSIASYNQAEAELMSKLEEAENSLSDMAGLIGQIEDIDAEQDLKRQQLAEAQIQLQTLQLYENVGQRVRLLSSAEQPDERAFPRLTIMLPGAVALFVGAAAGFIVLKELREQRVRTPRDIALIPRTRVLGILPELKMDPSEPERVETAVRDKPLGVMAETSREIRNAILKACDARGHKTIVFASGLPGSGTTTVVLNTAIAAAAVEHRVLVIDANLRRPRIHRLLDVNEGPGLAEVLRGTTSLDQAIQRVDERLDVLTAGVDRAHMPERLGTPTMTDLLQAAKNAYDLVVIDAPPAVVAGDALALAARCDASVLICKAYAEKRGLVARLRSQFGDARADFLGVIVNAVRAAAGGYLKANYKATVSYQDYDTDTK